MSRKSHQVATTKNSNTTRIHFGSSLRIMITLASFACIIIALVLWNRSGSAATPSSGTVSLASPSLTYTSGPFLVSNPSGQSGAVICNAALPCDEFTLTVSGLPTLGTTHDLVITTSWPVAAEDYDIYLRQGGVDIKSAASSSDPEIMTVNANPGLYTIRIVPFAVAGSSTSTTVALVEKPTNPPPPPPGPGTPRYHNFAATGALGNGAAEPSLGVGLAAPAYPDGRTMYIAGLETLRTTWNDCSSPASAPAFPTTPTAFEPLWEDVSAINTQVVSLDPILFTDFQTGRTFASQLGTKCSNMSFSDNDGGVNGTAPGDWTPSQGCGINSGVDHQTVGGGPFRPGLPDGTGLYPNAVYYASQDVAVAQAAISRDGGLTFGPAVPMYNLTQCGGLHGHIKVAPDGTVYMPNKGCGGMQGVVVSQDEGVTWTVRPVPGSSPGDTDPSVGIDTNGKIYFSFANGNGHAMVAVSNNKGATWSTPIDVGAPFGIQNTVFPAAVGGSSTGGDTGRAAVMYLATETPGNYEATGVFTGVWHIYAAHTFDGGLTWTTVRVTPANDPVQRGSICTSGTTCSGGDRNLLDFNDMGIDHQGRLLIAYADGCIGCTSPTGADSRADKATIARQSGGMRMLAAFDPNPAEPKVPANPRVNGVTQSAPGTTVHLDWSEPDNGGSPLTGYKIYRKDGAAPYALLATVNLGCPACKTTYDDTTATNTTTTYLYKVTATNAIGEGSNCGEFQIGQGGPGENICEIPGVTKLTDPGGDTSAALGIITTPAPPGSDLLSFQLAQPYAPDGVPKLVFTINTDPGQSPQPTGSAWYVAISKASGGYKAVHMAWNPTSPATPTFESYTPGPNNAGGVDGRFVEPGTQVPAEPESSYAPPYNKVVIVVKLSDLGLSPGDVINGFVSGVSQSTDPGAIVGAGATALYDEMPNGLAFTGSYTVNANAFCQPNAVPIAVLTAAPTSGNAPLLVNFDGSGSHDTDTPPDTIVSYTFNFGDGSPEETRTVAMFGAAAAMTSHTYTDAGVYPAILRVTDSRGAVSDNLARVVINVEEVATGPFNYALDSNGGVVTASSSPPNGRWPAISAINGDRNGASWGAFTGGWNDNTRDLYPDWLDVAFSGAAKSIDEIRVYTLQNGWRENPGEPGATTSASNEGILNFEVQMCSSNCTVAPVWVTVPGGSVTGNTLARRVFTFAPAINTSRIRVLVTASRNGYSRIVEFEAFGASGQP